MDFTRLKRTVLIGFIAAAVLFALGAVAIFLNIVPSPKPGRNVTVDLQIVTDTAEYYWAAVYVAEPLTADEYREIAKSIGDERFNGRYGQVQVFDNEWVRDMELPENRHIQLSDD